MQCTLGSSQKPMVGIFHVLIISSVFAIIAFLSFCFVILTQHVANGISVYIAISHGLIL
jgi:hypothetical protein